MQRFYYKSKDNTEYDIDMAQAAITARVTEL